MNKKSYTFFAFIGYFMAAGSVLPSEAAAFGSGTSIKKWFTAACERGMQMCYGDAYTRWQELYEQPAEEVAEVGAECYAVSGVDFYDPERPDLITRVWLPKKALSDLNLLALVLGKQKEGAYREWSEKYESCNAIAWALAVEVEALLSHPLLIELPQLRRYFTDAMFVAYELCVDYGHARRETYFARAGSARLLRAYCVYMVDNPELKDTPAQFKSYLQQRDRVKKRELNMFEVGNVDEATEPGESPLLAAEEERYGQISRDYGIGSILSPRRSDVFALRILALRGW